MSATGKLVSFVCQLDANALPAPVLDQAVRCVLDLVGVAIAGTSTPMAQISARFAHEQFASGNATVIGSRSPLSVTGATWVNGAYASALDMDDGHRMAMGHPGASVIPAALAIAECTGASGKEFLAALVAGYEVAVRASAARVPWYKDKMYSTGIWGVFGATAAAGKLLEFDEATLQSALGNAGSHGPFPPGGLQSNHAMVKEVIAWSGMTGVSAALLAQQNFLGPADFLDYSERWDTSALVAGLGDLGESAILQTYFKPYAVCRWAHPAVDGVLGAEAPAPAADRGDRSDRGRDVLGSDAPGERSAEQYHRRAVQHSVRAGRRAAVRQDRSRRSQRCAHSRSGDPGSRAQGSGVRRRCARSSISRQDDGASDDSHASRRLSRQPSNTRAEIRRIRSATRNWKRSSGCSPRI